MTIETPSVKRFFARVLQPFQHPSGAYDQAVNPRR
jgi:hypothetical protein